MHIARYRIAVMLCVGPTKRTNRDWIVVLVRVCLCVKKGAVGSLSLCVCMCVRKQRVDRSVGVCMCAEQTKTASIDCLHWVILGYIIFIILHHMTLHCIHTIIYHIEIYYIIIYYLLWSKLHHWIIAAFALKPQVVLCCSPLECGGKRRSLSALGWFQPFSTQVFSQKWLLQVRVRLVFLIKLLFDICNLLRDGIAGFNCSDWIACFDRNDCIAEKRTPGSNCLTTWNKCWDGEGCDQQSSSHETRYDIEINGWRW